MMDKANLALVIDELRKVHQLHKQLMMTHCHEMTPDQGKLLFLISQKTMNQKELADVLHITEATLSVRIKRLIDAGYIERQIDQMDKRKNAIILSQEGKQHIENMNEYMKKYHVLMSRGITQEEFDMVIHVIKKIQKNLKEEMQ